LLFDSIEGIISSFLQASKISIGKENYVRGKFTSIPSKKGELPALSIYDVEVSFAEQTLGSNVKEEREESSEAFMADGKETTFVLSTRPLRPIIQLENPQGSPRREGVDFVVDYENGAIKFRTPPERSTKKSVVVRFFPLQSVSLVSGLAVNAKYNLDVWGASRDECNDLATEIVKTILLGRDSLASQGIVMKPLSIFSIESPNGTGAASQSFGRRLYCEIITDLNVPTPIPAIEKIELRKKDFESSQ
jgi:hypothetical protein